MDNNEMCQTNLIMVVKFMTLYDRGGHDLDYGYHMTLCISNIYVKGIVSAISIIFLWFFFVAVPR